MGCGGNQGEAHLPAKISTVTGSLKITVLNAFIKRDASVFKLDPYVVVQLSNQQKTSKVVSKGDKEPVFNEAFTFCINSCYKIHGRNLEVTLMDKKKVGSDNQIGFGIVDLDPVIKFKKPRDQFRCFINYDSKDAGYVNLIAEFKEENAKTLSFRFETASIRRKTSTFGNMNCKVRVVIGEEVLETSKQKDTKEAPPVWKDEVLTFNVAESIKICEIFVMDEDEVIGDFDVEVKDLFAKNDEQSFNEEFEHNNEVNAGSLKFNTIVGSNPVFSEIKTVHKKKKKQEEGKGAKEEEKKEEDKKEDKKEQKKEEKKEEPVSEIKNEKKEEVK